MRNNALLRIAAFAQINKGLKSFINNDNPNLPDCTGRFATDGSLSILLDDDLQKLYNSDNFNSWCSSYGKTPSDFPLEFAIGYVEDSSNELRYFLDKESELEIGRRSKTKK